MVTDFQALWEGCFYHNCNEMVRGGMQSIIQLYLYLLVVFILK